VFCRVFFFFFFFCVLFQFYFFYYFFFFVTQFGLNGDGNDKLVFHSVCVCVYVLVLSFTSVFLLFICLVFGSCVFGLVMCVFGLVVCVKKEEIPK